MADDLLQPPITAAPTTLPSPPPPPPPTATATATTAPPSFSDNQPGPVLAPKRQRRPSVRLGEIGDPPSSYDSQHLRRPKPKFPKDNSSFSKASASASASASVKARSLTNLVNGAGDYSHETLNPDENGTNFDRRVANKAKRRRAVRSGWVSNSKVAAVAGAGAGAEEEDSDEEGFRDMDHPESESPLNENMNMSPAQFPDDWAFDLWNGHRRTTGDGGGGDGVRTWLIELGLSRYAPVFEIHEVDEEVLPMLTLEDLKDMGINAVGSRRKMYTAIQKLRKSLS